MVIVKVNANIHPTTLAELRRGLREQARTGALVLPPYCELLAEVPDGTEVEVGAGQDTASDCTKCREVATCRHYSPAIRRKNCPLWRAKV